MKNRLLCAIVVFVFSLVFNGTASAGAIFDSILKKGELVVGVSGDQAPLNALSKEGSVIGLDADIAKLIAANLNLKIRFAKMQFSELLPALQAGKVDMVISGMSMTPVRNTKVPFVGPYFISGKGILLKIKNVEMLKKEGINSEKFKITTLKGSTSQEVVENGAPKAKLILAGSYDEALNLLYNDKVDILIADYPYCAYIASRYSEKELAVGDTKLSFEPLGIAVREDALYINAVDNFLKLITGTGELELIRQKWFSNREWFKLLPN